MYNSLKMITDELYVLTVRIGNHNCRVIYLKDESVSQKSIKKLHLLRQ